MPKYDHSDQALMQREYLGTKVYMASHPKMRSLFRSDARPTDFGDKVWNSTLSLMHYLDGRTIGRVIDIGCGWGILGIHLARNNGARVTCVDADPNLQEVVELHSQLNHVRVNFKTAAFDALQIDDLSCDLLVGSEVCYSEAVAADLTKLIERAANAEVAEVLIADPGRPDFDHLASFCRNRFRAEVSENQLEGDSKPTLLLSVRF